MAQMIIPELPDELWEWLRGSPAKPFVSELTLRRISRLAWADQLTALKTWCSWALEGDKQGLA